MQLLQFRVLHLASSRHAALLGLHALSIVSISYDAILQTFPVRFQIAR